MSIPKSTVVMAFFTKPTTTRIDAGVKMGLVEAPDYETANIFDMHELAARVFALADEAGRLDELWDYINGLR